MWADFHFLRPWWLLAFVPLLVYLSWFVRQRFELLRWQQVIDSALAPHMLIFTGAASRRRVAVLLGVAGALLITALAGPAWQRAPQPVFRNLDALVIVLDLSDSMNVADLKPSRLERARYKINDVLTSRTDGQTALIAYAADAYVISPLTDDVNTIKSLLPALSTDLMPQQGSRADRGLEKARQLLRQAGAVTGGILLITDGVNTEQVTAVVGQLAADGISTSILGVGTADGGPIPGREGFVTQSDGSIVIARLDNGGLEELAREGEGQYRQIAADDNDINALLESFSATPDTTAATELQTDTWREEGPWLLLPLLLLAALAFRRGVLALWVLVLVLPVQPARAMDFADWWSRPDQRASKLFEAGDADAAAGLFADPAWKAAAAYRAGRYADSLAALEGLEDVEASYNRGNALAQMQRYDEAIAAYDEVLQRDPDHSDARFNRDLLKKLQQQQQQQQQGDQGQQDGSQDGKQQQQGEQGQQDGQQQQQDQQDGQQQQQGRQQQAGDEGRQDGEQQAGQSEQARENAQDSAMQEQPAATNPAEGSAGAGDEKDASGAQPEAAGAAPAVPQEQGREEGAESASSAAASGTPIDEGEQSAEQWLRTIPDDPGGLLRRKFYYQYQQQAGQQPEEQPW